MKSNTDLRHQLREQRASLPPAEQQRAASELLKHLSAFPILKTGNAFAGYCATQGEISAYPLLDHLIAAGKTCYLPVIDAHKEKTLHFCPYTAGTPLTPGPFNIPAPPFSPEHAILPAALDAVFLPLVSFDKQGNRLGCGCGYYDTCFAFCKTTSQKRPLLIGLAYGFQEVPALQPAAWDVPLDAIITPERVFIINTACSPPPAR